MKLYSNLGSVFGVKKSKKENAKRVLVITHMDESGLMITKLMIMEALNLLK